MFFSLQGVLIQKPHQFDKRKEQAPAPCIKCGEMIWGLFKGKGFSCTVCKGKIENEKDKNKNEKDKNKNEKDKDKNENENWNQNQNQNQYLHKFSHRNIQT